MLEICSNFHGALSYRDNGGAGTVCASVCPEGKSLKYLWQREARPLFEELNNILPSVGFLNQLGAYKAHEYSSQYHYVDDELTGYAIYTRDAIE